MKESAVILFLIAFSIVGIALIIGAVYLMGHKRKENMKNTILSLERDKNLIVSASLLTEMNKLENLLNNDYLKNKYKGWKETFDFIKDKEVPRLTNEIQKIDDQIELNNLKCINELITKVEIDLFYVKTKSDLLLEEVKTITMSEERNRNAVTKLKSLYREVISKYNKTKNDFKEISNPIDLQFENIDKLFSAFERSIDNKEYEEVGKIVKALDDLINNMNVVVDESPTVLFMGNVVIPKKINDIKNTYKKMCKDGYNLEYLNFEVNEEEANKKLNDILDKLKVLNLEDSIFELKTMLDYFDSLYNDFEKEKEAKKGYEKLLSTISTKINKLLKNIKNIYVELANLKVSYDLTEEELQSIDDLNKELVTIKDEFKLLNDRTKIKVMPFSKIVKDLELLAVRLNTCDENISLSMKSLGSLKEDEIRARDQLVEIKNILKDATYKIREYKLPYVSKNYDIEYKEAKESLSYIVSELEKKPINIKTLNTRVDTGRDLALKVYNTAKELSKTAGMAEIAIVYGNRYRSTYKEVDAGLFKAEKEFYKGNYRSSLEIALNVLNIVEPGIHKKLLSAYQD